MRRWVAGALLLLTGCSAPALAGTEIGAPSGVSVTALAPYAADVDALSLTMCWTGADCVESAVDLMPGSDTVDQGLQRYRAGRHLLSDRRAQ